MITNADLKKALEPCQLESDYARRRLRELRELSEMS